MKKKYEKLITRGEIRKSSEIKCHLDSAPGLRYLYLDQSKIIESSLYIVVRVVKNVQENQPEYIEPHIHNCDSAYSFIGDNDDLTGLKAEVVIENEKYHIESPASVFVPKGLKHYYRLIGGTGKYISFVTSGDYDKSIVAEKD